MKLTIRLATRDWDYLVPLLLGDLRSADFDLAIDRVNSLPSDLANDSRYDAGEVSFSRYSLARFDDDNSIVGVPHFLMRAFRHRCILTSTHSSITQLSQLAGKRIGLTGWHDSGNIWTKALVRLAGINLDEVNWYIGRLTKDHALFDTSCRYGKPSRIALIPDESSLIDLLHQGELDAVFTAFMPPDFFNIRSEIRQLIPDFRKSEIDYFNSVGYVPGIHILGIKPAIVQAHPWLPNSLSELLDKSARIWLEKRQKYADTTPWLIEELQQTGRTLPLTWNQNGFLRNERMIADFGAELHAQRMTSRCLSPKDLFPSFV